MAGYRYRSLLWHRSGAGRSCLECGDVVNVRRYNERMGLLLLIEFLAASWGGIWVVSRWQQTPFWVMFGWFMGAAAFAVLYAPLISFNAQLLA